MDRPLHPHVLGRAALEHRISVRRYLVKLGAPSQLVSVCTASGYRKAHHHAKNLAQEIVRPRETS